MHFVSLSTVKSGARGLYLFGAGMLYTFGAGTIFLSTKTRYEYN
jgi:hypothetical protein